jgi:hypothetical protein
VADLCTCGSGSPRNLDHTLSCPHSRPWSERAKAQQELDAADATHPRHVAYEFFNPATGHAIVDYSEFTHVGRLTAERGYLKLPLVYADAMQAGDAPSDMDYGNGMNVSAGDAGAVLSDEQIERAWESDGCPGQTGRELTPTMRAFARAILASAPHAAVPEAPKLICPRCHVDRTKAPCPQRWVDCAMVGIAQTRPLAAMHPTTAKEPK